MRRAEANSPGTWTPPATSSCAREADQPIRRELGETANAEQRHVAIDFIGQQADRVPHARLSTDRRGESERAAHEYKPGAECQRLEHVGAAAHAAVHHDRDVRARCYDVGQNPQRRHSAVELTAAVVRYDDAFGARVAGNAGVRGVENAFDYESPLPESADQFEVLPVQMSPVRIVAHDAGRDAP